MTNRRSYQSIAGHHATSEGLPPSIAANERGDLQSGWGIGRPSLLPMKRSKVYSSLRWWPAASWPNPQVSISFHLTFRLSWWPLRESCLILWALLLPLSLKVVGHLTKVQVIELALNGFLYPLTRSQHPSRWAWHPSYASSSNKEYIPHWVADPLPWPPSIQGSPVCACILYIKYTECSSAYL